MTATPVPDLDETVIAAAAIAALAPAWPEHWTEVPCATGRVDVVGRDAGGELHAVEVKMRGSLALVAQVCDRLSERAFRTILAVVGVTDESYYRRSGAGADLSRVAREIGFGVAIIRHKPAAERHPASNTFELLIPPRPLETEPHAVASISRALNDVHRAAAAAAGSTSSAYWTLWKQGTHELEQLVAKEPGLSPSDAAWKLRPSGVLYWQNERQQIRKMAELSKKILIEYEKGRLRYFPVAA